jgi:hypothetical protein
MARCTIPAAKEALRAALAGALDPAAVLVRVHLPTTVPKPNLRAYITSTENLTRAPVTEQGAMREQYDLVLLLESRTWGTDPQPAADGLFELLDALDTLLLTDPEIGGTVDDSWLAQVPAENTLPLADNKGWLSRAEVRITVRAIV